MRSSGAELPITRFFYQNFDPPIQPVPPANRFVLDYAGGHTIPFFFDAQIGVFEALWGERHRWAVQPIMISSMTIGLAVCNSASGVPNLPARSRAGGRNARFSYIESLIFTGYTANRFLQFGHAAFPLCGKWGKSSRQASSPEPQRRLRPPNFQSPRRANWICPCIITERRGDGGWTHGLP